MKKKVLSPLEYTLSILNNKWKFYIIRELLSGEKRFNELKNGINGITNKLLIQKLRELEGDNFISIEKSQTMVKYSLTDLGYTLFPVIESLNNWGKDYKKYIKVLEKSKK